MEKNKTVHALRKGAVLTSCGLPSRITCNERKPGTYPWYILLVGFFFFCFYPMTVSSFGSLFFLRFNLLAVSSSDCLIVWRVCLLKVSCSDGFVFWRLRLRLFRLWRFCWRFHVLTNSSLDGLLFWRFCSLMVSYFDGFVFDSFVLWWLHLRPPWCKV